MADEQQNVRDGFDLIDYPCEYVFKAVGRATPKFEMSIRQDVAAEVGEASMVRETSIASRNGRYLSMTFVVRLDDRQQLEALYAVLANHPGVVMTL
jgi:putative lipoic acid-binding regulatory protein